MSEILSLTETSGLDDLIEYYEKNCHRPWNEWLRLKKIFKRSGKQGIVGLFESTEDNFQYIFKLSQYMNYLPEHELSVSKSIKRISSYCPNFVNHIGTINIDIEPDRNEKNPFEIKSKYPIEKKVLLSQNIEHSKKLINYIRSKKIDEDVILSIIKQTLLAISIAQKKENFTHYDLHSNNIMIKRCNKDLVFLYVLDEHSQYYVPSYGYYPVIIDYGFSYAKEMEGEVLWPSLNFTNIGFSSHIYDQIADPKLFLVTVSDEFDSYKHCKTSKKFRKIIRNIYGELDIDWSSGWDTNIKKCISDHIYDYMKDISKFSHTFHNYPYYCIDILQTLIQCPIENNNKKDIDIPFSTFIYEFIKIEKEISSPFYCIYLLKCIVDIARIVKEDYVNSNKERAVNYFKTSFLERVDSISKFCNLKDIHYEKMLCSLLCLEGPLERIIHKYTTRYTEKKEKDHRKIKYDTPEKVVGVLTMDLPDDYIFNENTKVAVVDMYHERFYIKNIDDEDIDLINSFDSISKGCELYKILKKSS